VAAVPAREPFPGGLHAAAGTRRRTCATARTRTRPRLLPRGTPGGGPARALGAAAGQGAQLQQHRRCRRGLGVREELRRTGLRRSSSTPTPAAWPWAPRWSRPTTRPGRPTRPRPSAASSPSTGRSTKPPRGDQRAQAVRRGADRAGRSRRGARAVRRQAQRAPARGAAGRGGQCAGLQARRRRHAAADPRPEERGARRAARRDQLAPTAQQMDDLLFAWKVAKFVKSNAIVFCGGGMTLGVGAGQMSRIDSARIARIKAGNAGLSLAGIGGGQRRLLPVPRRAGRGHRRRRGLRLRHPARRLDARRRGHRRRRRARHRDGRSPG
jgi:hypothetical protein